MKRFLTTLFLVFSLNLSALEPIVEQITFVDDKGEELLIESEELNTKLGQVINSDKLILDVNTLKENLPQYQNILLSINPIDDDNQTVQVLFELQLKRTIKSIRLLADEGVKIPLNLRENLRSQRHAEFDSSNIERDKQTIIDHFVKIGYPETTVDHEALEYGNNEEVELTFRIKTNSHQLIVKKLKFQGNESYKSSHLKKLFKSKPRGFFLSRHTTFSLFQFQKDISKLTDYYRETGFLDVKVGFNYRFDSNGNAFLDVLIDEGKRYEVKHLLIYHNQLYQDDELKDFKVTKFYNNQRLRAALQNIREFFGKRGHAKVQALSHYDSVNKEVVVRVVEGPVFYIENVVVEGNERMKTETVLLDTEIEMGQKFDSIKIEETIRKMRATGYYEDVRVDFEPISEDSGNVVIIVREARTKTISFGAGTGTNGIMGELSFSDRNFLNSGSSVSLHLRKMAEMTKLGLAYRDPHLFNSDYALKLSTSFSDSNQDDFEERKIAASLMIEKKISDNLKVGVGTRIEFLNLSDIDEEIRLADHYADGEDRILGMVGTLFYKTETKDAAGDTSDGIKISMAMLPSYSDQGAYLKTFSTVMATKSVWENERGVSHSISGRFTVGYASENTPFHEKFYAGGAGTLRGFKRNSIKTEEGDGGQMLVSSSVGYSFPVWEDKVKGVVFLEAASVGDTIEDLGNIRAVGGIGVKANLMDTFLGSVIEAGVAIPLRRQDGDEVKPFYFIFGDYDPAYDL
ncbi:MAG: BamA/TamA family outer membrane protein [Halobacteriovoraceae bacterium]|nr:BamA/TamA family outer membrane protein [Halobacteriovoraceae bacterium]